MATQVSHGVALNRGPPGQGPGAVGKGTDSTNRERKRRGIAINRSDKVMGLEGLLQALAAVFEQLAYALGLASPDGAKKRPKPISPKPADKS